MNPMLKEQPQVRSSSFSSEAKITPVQENRRKSARLHAQTAPKYVTNNVSKDSIREEKSSPPKAELTFHLAQSTWDHIQAFHLLHEQYLTFGYLSSHLNRVHISPWNLEETSHTLVALQDHKKTVGTITNLKDSVKGFPADQSYPDELGWARNNTESLLELSSFALHYGMDSQGASLKCLAAALFYARHILKGTAWVCTVNPRHASFYKNIMLFKQIGEVRSCQSANGAPSVLLYLDFQNLSNRYQAKYGKRSGRKNLYKLFFDPSEVATRIDAYQKANLTRKRRWVKIKNCLQSLSAQ